MFSKSGQYAIRAILFLALNDESNKLKVDDIAEELEIPKHYLAKILQQLTKSEIISSAKGRNGGFYMTKEKRALNMLSAVQAIDGPIKPNDCILGLKECSDSKPCPYHFSVSKYRNKFYKELKNETIESCARRVDVTKLKNKLE